jgi:hypothetical protein
VRLRQGLAHCLGLGELAVPPLPKARLGTVPPAPPPAAFPEGSDTRLPASRAAAVAKPPPVPPPVPAAPPAAGPFAALFADRPPSWSIPDEAGDSFSLRDRDPLEEGWSR